MELDHLLLVRVSLEQPVLVPLDHKEVPRAPKEPRVGLPNLGCRLNKQLRTVVGGRPNEYVRWHVWWC